MARLSELRQQHVYYTTSWTPNCTWTLPVFPSTPFFFARIQPGRPTFHSLIMALVSSDLWCLCPCFTTVTLLKNICQWLCKLSLNWGRLMSSQNWTDVTSMWEESRILPGETSFPWHRIWATWCFVKPGPGVPGGDHHSEQSPLPSAHPSLQKPVTESGAHARGGEFSCAPWRGAELLDVQG